MHGQRIEQRAPHTRREIVQALKHVEGEVATFFSELPEELFIERQGGAWSPAEHLVHLNISVQAVGRALSVMPLLYLIRFRPARVPSRSYGEVADSYRAQLAAGGKAPAPFVPKPVAVSKGEIPIYRAGILSRWAGVNLRLRGAIGDWKERDLDRVRMPHPLLGLITAREMLLFTLYHNQHHVEVAQRRLAVAVS
jgi:hypothetical protein